MTWLALHLVVCAPLDLGEKSHGQAIARLSVLVLREGAGPGLARVPNSC